MIWWFFKRLFSFAGHIAFVVVLMKALLFLLPGDPIDFLLGEEATAKQRQELNALYGFDQHFITQCLNDLINFFSLDWGASFFRPESTFELLVGRIQPSFVLALVASLFCTLFSFAFYFFYFLRKNKLPRLLLDSVSYTSLLLPISILGPITLFALAVYWPIFPLGGYKDLSYAILPALSLALCSFGALFLQLKKSAQECEKELYVLALKAKGLSRKKIVALHIFRNAVIPYWVALGAQFAGLVSGSVMAESIFDYPGLGLLLYEALSSRDYYLAQASLVIIYGLYYLIFSLVDLGNRLIDPRLRVSR